MRAAVETLAPSVGLAPACRALGVARASVYRHRKLPVPKTACHMNNASLRPVQCHTQRTEDLLGFGQHLLGLCPGAACHDPIISVPRQPIATMAHLPIKRSQKDVTEDRRDHTALRCTLLGRQAFTLRHAACFEHAANQTQHPTVRHPLGNESKKLLVIRGPKEIRQIRVHNPLVTLFDLLPDLA